MTNTKFNSIMDTQSTSEEAVSASQLFGSVRLLPFVGNLPVPKIQLREPLPDGEYGVHLFCSGCGLVQPVLKPAIPAITGRTLGSYEGMYIQVERCEFDGSDHLVGARLLPIPMDS